MNFKKIILILLSFTLIFASASSVSGAASERSWYIKRNGNCRPSFPEESELLSSYNAFFINDDYPDAREEKRLYITFDCGYENGNVKKILDVLSEEGVPAAFFLLDNIIVKNGELVKRMDNEGHLVCNHTKRHKNLCNSSKDEISADLSALEELCLEYTGVKMSKFFRFPEGKYSIEALSSVNELGYKTVFWSFAYDDWDNGRQMNEERALKKILDNTHNGEIILLHPTSKTNASIMKRLISCWRDMGYTFGRLDEI